MAGETVFFDTNIVLYSLQSLDARKKAIAQELLTSRIGCISAQVMLEAASNLVAKFGVTRQQVDDILDPLLPLVVPTTAETVSKAFRLMARYQFSIWDAAIVASALEARCRVLYTEDLQHGQTIEGLKVVNPFR